MTYDVIIIGAGVTGCAVARELSRYDASVMVIEKEEDVCCGTSKANSGIVHAGFDCMPGTMMARMNVRGNEMMDDLCRDLDIPFKRNGSLVVSVDSDDVIELEELYERGVANGVKGMRILNREEALEMEPNLTEHTTEALYAPTAGIICPFRLTIAMGENACENGVEFRFSTEVTEIKKGEDNLWHIATAGGDEIAAKRIVNAAGVYADKFHNMVSGKKINIRPRRGEYFLLDKAANGYVGCTVFPQPTTRGKGTLVAPTIHGNLIFGPTADFVDDKEATCTSAEGLETLRTTISVVKNPPLHELITNFAGLRAREDGHEFILGEPEDAPGFFDCAGIESPGLTSAPAIGEYIGGMIKDSLALTEKSGWISTRRDVKRFSEMSAAEADAKVKENPAYGHIICRCEHVTEGEILDAIHRPLGAKSLDGIKRRTRSGMGRCQGGFCGPRVMEILNRELGIPMTEITKTGGKSVIVREHTKLAAEEAADE